MVDVDPDPSELIASFDGRSVTYGFGELDTLVSVYAATSHKSQGSEYPAVVIPIMSQHYAMLQRNPASRGKRRALVGQKKAVASGDRQKIDAVVARALDDIEQQIAEDRALEAVSKGVEWLGFE